MNRKGRGFICLIILLFVLNVLLGANLSAVDAQTPVSLATILTHIKVGWLKLASVEVAQVLEAGFPVDEEFLVLSGLLLSTNGQPGLAREAYLRALSTGRLQEPNQATLLALIGRTYFDQRDYRRAKEYYRQALSRSEDQVFSLLDLGAIALSEGELELAGEYLARAEKAGGETSVRLLILRGDLAVAGQDYSAALSRYQAALKLAPSEAQIYYRLRQVYQLTGRDAEWAALVEQAKKYGIEL